MKSGIPSGAFRFAAFKMTDRLIFSSAQQCQLSPLPVAIRIHKANLTEPPKLRFQVQQLVRRILRLNREPDPLQKLLV